MTTFEHPTGTNEKGEKGVGKVQLRVRVRREWGKKREEEREEEREDEREEKREVLDAQRDWGRKG